MREEVGSEPEAAAQTEMDVQLTTEQTELQTELVRMEAKELALRRKRWGADLTEAEREAIDFQASQLLVQVGQKRRKLEHDVEAAAASACQGALDTTRCSRRCLGTSLAWQKVRSTTGSSKLRVLRQIGIFYYYRKPSHG